MKKLLILIAFLSIILVSCNPCRRLHRRCPQQAQTITKDSIIIKDTVIYHDRIIRDTIKGDTSFIERPIIPIINKTWKPLMLENDYAIAKSWVKDNSLKLELILKEQVINKIIKDAEKETLHWQAKYFSEQKKEIVPVRYFPWYVKFSLWFTGISIVLIIVYVGINIHFGPLLKKAK